MKAETHQMMIGTSRPLYIVPHWLTEHHSRNSGVGVDGSSGDLKGNLRILSRDSDLGLALVRDSIHLVGFVT